MSTNNIEQFLSKLHEQYQFNYGGCCYVAYVIAECLEQLGEQFWLVIESDKTQHEANHYSILSENYGYINSIDSEHKIRFRASSSTILRIYNDNEWSQCYDRSNNVQLRKQIRSFFDM